MFGRAEWMWKTYIVKRQIIFQYVSESHIIIIIRINSTGNGAHGVDEIIDLELLN